MRVGARAKNASVSGFAWGPFWVRATKFRRPRMSGRSQVWEFRFLLSFPSFPRENRSSRNVWENARKSQTSVLQTSAAFWKVVGAHLGTRIWNFAPWISIRTLVIPSVAEHSRPEGPEDTLLQVRWLAGLCLYNNLSKTLHLRLFRWSMHTFECALSLRLVEFFWRKKHHFDNPDSRLSMIPPCHLPLLVRVCSLQWTYRWRRRGGVGARRIEGRVRWSGNAHQSQKPKVYTNQGMVQTSGPGRVHWLSPCAFRNASQCVTRATGVQIWQQQKGQNYHWGQNCYIPFFLMFWGSIIFLGELIAVM